MPDRPTVHRVTFETLVVAVDRKDAECAAIAAWEDGESGCTIVTVGGVPADGMVWSGAAVRLREACHG